MPNEQRNEACEGAPPDPPSVIDQRDAVWAQLSCVAGNEPADRFVELRYKPRGGGMRQEFYRVGEPDKVIARIAELGQQDVDVYVGCAPRTRQHGGAVEWTPFRGHLMACGVRPRKDGVCRAEDPTCVPAGVPS